MTLNKVIVALVFGHTMNSAEDFERFLFGYKNESLVWNKNNFSISVFQVTYNPFFRVFVCPTSGLIRDTLAK